MDIQQKEVFCTRGQIIQGRTLVVLLVDGVLGNKAGTTLRFSIALWDKSVNSEIISTVNLFFNPGAYIMAEYLWNN